ncbi:unnamed protein product [Miscanthus lutarioriparius]|uniref:Uncharacterized protein n=1 Tax=Miscanthus lutarioriparius TaxID=422564 RepID=A0A811NIX4_9POAL|nr:unnamed protein product [Miscanthus lutarioriparius]
MAVLLHPQAADPARRHPFPTLDGRSGEWRFFPTPDDGGSGSGGMDLVVVRPDPVAEARRGARPFSGGGGGTRLGPSPAVARSG